MQDKMLSGKTNSYVKYLLYLFLLLPVFIYRDFTPPNELKYISIVEEALRNRTWFTFYNHGELYADKPPLFFWLLMFVKRLTGGYPMGIIGLFSLLPAIGVLVVMDRWMEIGGMKHHPIVSNLLLLTTFMFTGASLVMRMDMLMTFFIILSLYTFYRIYKKVHYRMEEYLLPVYIFLALFSKGPIGVLIPLLSMVLFLGAKKEIRTFSRYWGGKQWAILGVLCAVWFLNIYWEGGEEYLNNLLFTQTIGRGVNAFHHKRAIWYYFPWMLFTFAPWALLYMVILWQGIRRKLFTSDIELFFVIIVSSSVVMMSLISSKLNIYLLPIYPFVVYLCSGALERTEKTKWIKTAIGIPTVVWTIVFPVFVIGRKYIPYEYDGMLPYWGSGILTISGIAAAVLLSRDEIEKSITCIGAGFLLTVFTCSFMLPQCNRYIGFREMVESSMEKAESEKIHAYAYYKFATAENIDAYLGCPILYIHSVEQLDSLAVLPHKTILFVKDNNIKKEVELREWIDSRNVYWSNGRYRWYIVGDEKQPND